jgi:hypothetical protein
MAVRKHGGHITDMFVTHPMQMHVWGNGARVLHTVDLHAAGEPARVVVGGMPHVPGKTMYEKRAYIMENLDGIRKLLLLEPRGCVNSQEVHFPFMFLVRTSLFIHYFGTFTFLTATRVKTPTSSCRRALPHQTPSLALW